MYSEPRKWSWFQVESHHTGMLPSRIFWMLWGEREGRSRKRLRARPAQVRGLLSLAQATPVTCKQVRGMTPLDWWGSRREKGKDAVHRWLYYTAHKACQMLLEDLRPGKDGRQANIQLHQVNGNFSADSFPSNSKPYMQCAYNCTPFTVRQILERSHL